MVWHGMLFCVVSCRVVSCRVASCLVVSCYVMSCHVMSCHITSGHVMSCQCRVYVGLRPLPSHRRRCHSSGLVTSHGSQGGAASATWASDEKLQCARVYILTCIKCGDCVCYLLMCREWRALKPFLVDYRCAPAKSALSKFDCARYLSINYVQSSSMV